MAGTRFVVPVGFKKFEKSIKSKNFQKGTGVDKIQVGTIVFPSDFGLGTIDFPEKRAKVQ